MKIDVPTFISQLKTLSHQSSQLWNDFYSPLSFEERMVKAREIFATADIDAVTLFLDGIDKSEKLSLLPQIIELTKTIPERYFPYFYDIYISLPREVVVAEVKIKLPEIVGDIDYLLFLFWNGTLKKIDTELHKDLLILSKKHPDSDVRELAESELSNDEKV